MSYSPRLRALWRATRSLFCSFAIRRVTISRYFPAFKTIHPPTTRSIRRPSKSCPCEYSSGLSRISTALIVAGNGTLERMARFLTFPYLQNPSSSIEASNVIQTRTVSLFSSQMEESRMVLNSLLYMAGIVMVFPLQSITVMKCNAISIRINIRKKIKNLPLSLLSGGAA